MASSVEKKQPKWALHFQPGNTAATVFDDSRKMIYLKALSKMGRPYQAASEAGVSMQCVKRSRKSDPDFAEAEISAKEIQVEWLENRVDEMAFEGIDEPVYQGGELVGHKKRFSERLAELRLKAESPEKYRDNYKIDVTHGGGVLVAPAQLTPVEWAQQEAARMAVHRRQDAIPTTAIEVTKGNGSSNGHHA